jgi:hypothetical protein
MISSDINVISHENLFSMKNETAKPNEAYKPLSLPPGGLFYTCY